MTLASILWNGQAKAEVVSEIHLGFCPYADDGYAISMQTETRSGAQAGLQDPQISTERIECWNPCRLSPAFTRLG